MNAEIAVLNDVVHAGLLTFQESLNTIAGRNMPRVMRSIAMALDKGKSPLDVARDLDIPVSTVRKHYDHWIHCLRCQPPLQNLDWSGKSKDAKFKTFYRPKLGPGQLMIETKCVACGDVIEADSERIFICAMVLCYGLDEELETNMPQMRFSGSGSHFCMACVPKVREYRLSNVSYVSDWEWKQGELTAARIEIEKETLLERDLQRREAVARDETIRAALQEVSNCPRCVGLTECVCTLPKKMPSQIHSFNQANPTTSWAKRDDVLAKSVLATDFEQGAEDRLIQENGYDGPGEEPNTFEELITTNTPSRPSQFGSGSFSAGEQVQRVKVLGYLNSPISRGMRPDARKAARHWVDGLSQNQIAKKLGIDQSNVSRLIASVKGQAAKRR
jgi:hypothetical protein